MAMDRTYESECRKTTATAGAVAFCALCAMNIAVLMDTTMLVSIFVILAVVVVSLLVVLLSILITKTIEYGRMRSAAA